MNTIFKSWGVLFLLPFSGFGQSGRLVVSNNSGVSRMGEPIVVSRQALADFVDIPSGNKRLTLSLKGNPIPAQLDDLNQDGLWDELAFQINIERNSTAEIKLKWVDPEDVPVFPKKVQAWFGVSENQDGKFANAQRETRPDKWTAGMQPPRYQMEGPAWENDKVGFRQYFDWRNQKDVFGKKVANMVLDSVDAAYKDFHHISRWGMDVLETGSTLGAGSIAIMNKGEPVALHQTEYTHYQQIANGPARAMFDITYEGWNVAGQKLNVRERISIWAGKYWFKNEVTVSGFNGDRELAVGITNLKNPAQPVYKTNNLSVMSLCTHARQSEAGDMLGLGLLFHPKVFTGYGETPRYEVLPKMDSLSHTFYATLRIRGGQPVEYLFFAAWEQSDPKFGNAKYFADIVQEEADSREYPLTIGKK